MEKIKLLHKKSPVIFLLFLFNFSCQRDLQPSIDNIEVPKLYTANFTPIPLAIDGNIEDVWDQAAWSDSFIDIEGEIQPKYSTQVKMLWDENHLYILAQLHEPHIWGYLKQRDTVIFYNNDFEVFIDPDGDTHNYIELEVNALNTVWDLFLEKPYRNKVKVDNQWNIKGMQTAVSIQGTLNDASDEDQSWTVEMALPWEGLKRGNISNQIYRNSFWRINFSRVNWNFSLNNNRYERKKDKNGKFLREYNWVWSPQFVINMHEPERWGYVFFADRETPTDSIVIPGDAQLLQWMYAQYRNKLSLDKQNKTDDSTVTAFWKQKKVSFKKQTIQDTVYWTTTNPETKAVYQIRYDGKLHIKKEE